MKTVRNLNLFFQTLASLCYLIRSLLSWTNPYDDQVFVYLLKNVVVHEVSLEAKAGFSLAMPLPCCDVLVE